LSYAREFEAKAAVRAAPFLTSPEERARHWKRRAEPGGSFFGSDVAGIVQGAASGDLRRWTQLQGFREVMRHCSGRVPQVLPTQDGLRVGYGGALKCTDRRRKLRLDLTRQLREQADLTHDLKASDPAAGADALEALREAEYAELLENPGDSGAASKSKAARDAVERRYAKCVRTSSNPSSCVLSHRVAERLREGQELARGSNQHCLLTVRPEETQEKGGKGPRPLQCVALPDPARKRTWMRLGFALPTREESAEDPRSHLAHEAWNAAQARRGLEHCSFDESKGECSVTSAAAPPTSGCFAALEKQRDGSARLSCFLDPALEAVRKTFPATTDRDRDREAHAWLQRARQSGRVPCSWEDGVCKVDYRRAADGASATDSPCVGTLNGASGPRCVRRVADVVETLRAMAQAA